MSNAALRPFPLSGVRIVDLTRANAGPYATRMLGDMGAEVIKIETLRRMDVPLRGYYFAENDPKDEYWNRSGYFQRVNANKLGLNLDLTRPEGGVLFKRLVRVSDAVVENYSPRTMANFGLGYEALKEVKPDIIMVSLSGYGQWGPHRDRVAYAGGMEAEGGLSSVTGYPGGTPRGTVVAVGDWVLGASGAAALLTALLQRRRTGRGQHIDVAGREAVIGVLGECLLEFVMNRRVPGPQGLGEDEADLQAIFACRGDDQWVTLSVRGDRDFEALCRALGRPELVRDQRFADTVARQRNRGVLKEMVAAWARERTKEDAETALTAAGLPAGAVQNAKEVLLDPQLGHRAFAEVIQHPSTGRRPIPRQLSARFSASPHGTPRRPAPRFGEHQRLVMSELLGLSSSELADLEARQVIGIAPVNPAPPGPLRLERMTAAGATVENDYCQTLGLAYGDAAIGPLPGGEP